jgi:hypothetical protein
MLMITMENEKLFLSEFSLIRLFTDFTFSSDDHLSYAIFLYVFRENVVQLAAFSSVDSLVIFSVFFSTLNGKFRAILIDEKFFLLS